MVSGIFGNGAAAALNPGISIQIEIFGVEPSHQVLANISFVVGYSADNVEALRGLPIPWVQFIHTIGFAATEAPASPARVWRGTTPVTSDGKKGYSIAMNNPDPDTAVKVQGELYDERSVRVATQMWEIPPHGSIAFGLTELTDKVADADGYAPGFGRAMFQNSPKFAGRFVLTVSSP